MSAAQGLAMAPGMQAARAPGRAHLFWAILKPSKEATAK